MLNFRIPPFLKHAELPTLPTESSEVRTDEISVAASDDQRQPADAGQAAMLCSDLDLALLTLRTARSDADNLAQVVARLEFDAARIPALSEENRDLRQKLRKSEAEFSTLKTEETALRRDLDRARASLENSQKKLVELQQAREHLLLKSAEDRERIVALGETISRIQREVEVAEAARSKREIELSSLQSSLADRERAMETARSELSQLRLSAVRHQSRVTELCEENDEKSKRIEVLANELSVLRRQKEQFEGELEALRDQHQMLEALHCEQRISFNARISSLESVLTQERDQGEITRRLLDAERQANRSLAEEIRLQKQKIVSIAQENEQIKTELSSDQSAMREHSLRLCDATRNLAVVTDERDRLQAMLHDAQNENREMACRVNQLVRAEMENEQLRQKILALRDSVGELGDRGKNEQGNTFSADREAA